MLPRDHLFGHYRLVRRIGSGGMGEIFLAEDTRIARQVAIKVVRAETDPYPDPLKMQDAQRLFQREMRAITMLDHPNILPLLDFGEEKVDAAMITYMVMPFRQEGSLTDWLQRRGNTHKLTLHEVTYFVTQAADALQHAHDRQLIHQDVKPANFLIRDRSGRPLPDLLLTDFGIAKITTATATSSQSIRGTPAYMAPEQWEGHPSPATDQYALAIMAYLLLTGNTPFNGRMEQVMRQHFMNQPPPASRTNSAIPPALDSVLLRALEKQPAKRFPSISAFAQAFQQASLAGGANNPAKVPQALLPPTLPVSSASHPATMPASNPHLPVVNYPVLPPYQGRAMVTPIPPAQSPRTPPPISSPVVGQSPTPKRKSRSKAPLFFLLLIAILIIGYVGIAAYQSHIRQIAYATATANYDATSTANDYATATAQVYPTATSQALSTVAATNNPYPAYLPGHGTLAFFDPLSEANRWSSQPGGSCQFTNGSYHIRESQRQYFIRCDASGSFSNFAFEVHLTIIKGDCGGMTFREGNNNQFYFFSICQNGSYLVAKFINSNGSDAKTLRNASTPSILTGLNQQNKFAVVANGDTLTFYVNGQQIDQVHDGTYTSGAIGLIADSSNSDATEVAYNNARVWTL